LPSTLDLSLQPAVEICAATGALAPCGRTYCGLGSRCVPTASGPACACASGTAARWIGSLDGIEPERVICEEIVADVFDDPDLDIPSACTGFDCGRGECVGINGVPACVCGPGAVATLAGTGRPTCVDDWTTPVGPEQLLAPVDGAGASLGSGGEAMTLAGLLVVPVVGRRRLRVRTGR
jgi:hypothetical protein